MSKILDGLGLAITAIYNIVEGLFRIGIFLITLPFALRGLYDRAPDPSEADPGEATHWDPEDTPRP